MSKINKILLKLLSGASDSNIDFNDVQYLLEHLNFKLRIKGSHYIFYRNDITEIINLQPTENNKTKTYQVKQIRNLVIKYKLGELSDD